MIHVIIYDNNPFNCQKTTLYCWEVFCLSQAYVHISSKEISSSFVPLYPVEFTQDFMYVQRVGITYCLEDYMVRNRNIDSHLLCYVFHGEGTLEYKETTTSLKKGDLFLLDCSLIHSYFPNPENPFYLFFLHFNGPLTQKYVHYIIHNDHVFHNKLLTKDVVSKIGHLYKLFQQKSEISPFLLSEKIYTLLITLLNQISFATQESMPLPAAIASASKYIEENFASPILISDLAKQVSMSEYHFIREFKKYIHQSPYNYVLYCRFNHSKELLLTTSMSVAEISEFLCFNSVSHYTLFFKKRESMTPFQFRKRYMIKV